MERWWRAHLHEAWLRGATWTHPISTSMPSVENSECEEDAKWLGSERVQGKQRREGERAHAKTSDDPVLRIPLGSFF
jgi:hypothetical protein